MVSRALYSSNSVEWETPQWLFDLLDDEFKFSLDACASKESAKCWNYYTRKENGLRRRWEGSVWINPPYGRGLILPWLLRAKKQLRYKRVLRVVVLLPVRTSTEWWHRGVQGKAKELRFIRGRLRFVGAPGSGAAPFPSVVAIYDKRSWPYTRIGPSINARDKK